MITTNHLFRLIAQVEQMDQMLLDTDPDSELFWQITSVRDRKVQEIDDIRAMDDQPLTGGEF